MKTVVACIVLTLSAMPASSQVINGESTYEDNFEHVPPPEAQAPKPPETARTSPRDTAPAAPARERQTQ